MAPTSAAGHLLYAFLPADLAAFIQTHILHPSSPLQTTLRSISNMTSSAATTALPLLQPLLDRLAALLSENSGLTGLVALVLAFTAAVMVLQWIQRVIMWWTRLAVRVFFWSALVLVGSWVWQRGVYVTVRDLVVLGGHVMGYLAGVREVWESEYDRYSAQQQQQPPQQGSARVGGRGRSSWR